VQVALGHRCVVAPAGAENCAIALDEVRERIRDAIDQRCGQRSAAHTLTRRIDGFISPLPVPDVLVSQGFSSRSRRQVAGARRAHRRRSGRAGVAATVSVPFGGEHSGQRDFVKLMSHGIFPGLWRFLMGGGHASVHMKLALLRLNRTRSIAPVATAAR
jgi:hypothetical protein